MERVVFDKESSYDSDEFVAPTSESGEDCYELSTRKKRRFNLTRTALECSRTALECSRTALECSRTAQDSKQNIVEEASGNNANNVYVAQTEKISEIDMNVQPTNDAELVTNK
ncbi:uncharacterized protein LOC124815088 [Hydra vulgaris]|uniref:uncharacterized protein LOC124815088 n=1 Tax=Hydra vulgaris TaxID=6087 RepID=UPI001F5E720C|nr:uncharacterized protein LOC124815088 [Hydra vulgaris]